MSTSKPQYDAVVLGAGVLGLSIASELVAHGLKVAIIARDLPEDVNSAAFASPWAGANWSSFAKAHMTEDIKRDTITFQRFDKLAREYPDLVTRTDYEYYSMAEYETPWYRDLVFNYRVLDSKQIRKPATAGIAFTAYTVNPPEYIAHLAKRLRVKGVPIIRARLASLDEAYSLLGPVDLVVNASGLGARTLLGVEDTSVYPARGQTVLVRAPHMRKCMSLKNPHDLTPSKSTYLIPRPGPDGDGLLILGGCFQPNNFDVLPDLELAERILKDAFALCPEITRDGKGSRWEDIEVVRHNVGLRPCREGGMRLELEHRVVGGGLRGREGLVPAGGQRGRGRNVACVHAYGIGPAGFQSSLGIAEEATALAMGFMGNQKLKANI
ncbi:D-amino-acid oxidase, partial [Tremellales sp. Uapishka_1]